MAFTAKDVMALREKTGAGLWIAKKRLRTPTGIWRKPPISFAKGASPRRTKRPPASRRRASSPAIKRARRASSSKSTANPTSSPKIPRFTEIATELAKVALRDNPADVQALLACKADSGETVEEYLKSQIAVIGEKIAVRRFTIYKTEGFLASYIHLGGKLGVLLDMKGEETEAAKETAHEITLQIAFTKPAYLTEEEVSPETLEKEKEVLKQQAINEGKPEAIAEKMVQGRIKKFYEENCLLKQAFIKDEKKDGVRPPQSGGQSLDQPVSCFYVMGEGLEKKSEDLNEEVAKQVAAMKK